MAIPTLGSIHHIAIICSNYQVSKNFYLNILGGKLKAETHRAERQSYKLDVSFDGFEIELFSFPTPPERPSQPEAQGLRHLAFCVGDMDASVSYLESQGIAVEPIRIDDLTSNRYTFFKDPDGLPLELVETRAHATFN